MPSAPALAVTAVALALGVGPLGCKRSTHAHLTSYEMPPLPAGFVVHSGSGWRVAVPSTWKEAQNGAASWAVADPQAVDEFHANVNVMTEPFAGESYDYARANQVALQHEARAKVETARDDIVDGDPTLILETRWTGAPPATVAYRTLQGIVASRGTGYVVTCSVAAGAFERYRSTCESVVRSFAVER